VGVRAPRARSAAFLVAVAAIWGLAGLELLTRQSTGNGSATGAPAPEALPGVRVTPATVLASDPDAPGETALWVIATRGDVISARKFQRAAGGGWSVNRAAATLTLAGASRCHFDVADWPGVGPALFAVCPAGHLLADTVLALSGAHRTLASGRLAPSEGEPGAEATVFAAHWAGSDPDLLALSRSRAGRSSGRLVVYSPSSSSGRPIATLALAPFVAAPAWSPAFARYSGGADDLFLVGARQRPSDAPAPLYALSSDARLLHLVAHLPLELPPPPKAPGATRLLIGGPSGARWLLQVQIAADGRASVLSWPLPAPLAPSPSLALAPSARAP